MKDIMQQEKEKRLLVWSEEFTLPELDLTKWSFERLMGNPGNEYCNDEKHARIENGMLHLQVHRKDEQSYSLPESVTTKYSMLYRYGYVEMKAKIPFRHGVWPSFWMKGDTPFLRCREGRNDWFPELDIFENFASNSYIVSNLHKWGNVDGKAVHEQLPEGDTHPKHSYDFKNLDTLNEEYHIYGMLWDEHTIKCSVDGEVYFSVNIDEKTEWKSENYPDVNGFHDPMYLIINNEVFTDTSYFKPDGAALTLDDLMPIDYYVDYVRLYQKDGEELITGTRLTKAYAKSVENKL